MLKRAELKDLNTIYEMFIEAKNFLKENNINQWQDGYPDIDTIRNDITNNVAYTLNIDDEIIAYLVITYDGDENYDVIDGKWSINEKYATIHRNVISNKYKGQGKAKVLFNEAFKLIRSNSFTYVRIDTHKDNFIMQKLLRSLGFKYCGVITLLKDNDLRDAFDLIL